MPPELQCANCGGIIGRLETPYTWDDAIVCGGCYMRLSQPLPAAQVVPRAAKALPKKYVDHLYWPRYAFLMLAVLFTGIYLIANSRDPDSQHSFGLPGLFWGTWFVLGLANIVMKAAWKQGR
jgi:hypothetical protein